MFPYTEGRNCFIIFLPVFYKKIGLFGGEQYGCFPAAQIYDFFLIVHQYFNCVLSEEYIYISLKQVKNKKQHNKKREQLKKNHKFALLGNNHIAPRRTTQLIKT
jgi:hypothetical protein